MAEQVWKAKGLPNGMINRDFVSAFAKQFWEGVKEGYGKDIPKVDYDTPDFNTLAKLQSNIWQFSGAKNYAQLRELSNALIGDDGKLRKYEQFKEIALNLNKKYVKQHLKTEYNLAVTGSQMAGKWVDIEANKQVLRYLEFDAVIDSQTTDLCRKLHGTILPVDHPFWRKYYPPNHFGERGTVRQRASGPVTDDDRIPSADIPPMFETNLGQQGLIFPKQHPYFTDIPEGILSQSMGALRKELHEIAKNRLQNKSVDVPGLGEVTFSSSGLKELFNQPHADYYLKNQLVPVADLMLQHASVIQTQDNFKQPGLKVHYLRVKGLSGRFNLVVKEMYDGRKVLYSIVDGLK